MAHPRILMLEGNTLATQKKAAALGVRSASEVYGEAVAAHFPDLPIDVLNGADRDQHLPAGAQLSDYAGLVISGSGLHAYDETFEVRNQIEVVRAYAETGGPILGSCWGLQIAVMAAGGSVALSPNGREIGIARKIVLNEAGRAHTFFKGKRAVFDAPCIHYDEVSGMPEGAVLLASNDHSAVQAAIVPVGASEVWAVQYHPEFDMAQLSMLMTLYGKAMISEGFFNTEEERAAHAALYDRLTTHADDASAAWRLGVDGDVLDDRHRRAEIINWVEACVLAAA